MISALLVDDEIHFIETLKAICSKIEDIKVVGEARSVKSGIAAIKQHKPDVVFLDVEMDDGTGFDLLRSIEQIDFHVVFVTAHDKYAIEAFRFSALDYLLKPIISSELFSTIAKLRDKLNKEKLSEQVSVFLQNMATPKQPNKIVLKESDAIHVVNVEEILYCEAGGSYTTFLLSDGRKITVSQNLKEYEDLLGSTGFLRVHRAYLVNLSKIKKLDKSDGGILILTGDVSLPVSVRKRDALIQAISNLNA
ncbi:MAG: response regulator transcription factor [Cyclobacteriaceae bacterium]|nr:response regulator transcription factor [Cyclobacteriaceae bacterium]